MPCLRSVLTTAKIPWGSSVMAILDTSPLIYRNYVVLSTVWPLKRRITVTASEACYQNCPTENTGTTRVLTPNLSLNPNPIAP